MTDQYLHTNQLETFAPNSPILAFRPHDTGSPQEDWCKHLQENPRYRRELEEFSILGDVVVRITDGIEPKPFERVKILSLEYAVKVLKDETDAKEFVRCVKAIASPDADGWELEQIASFYYKEIRRRKGETNKVLKEMGLLGLQMEAVTSNINERELVSSETDAEEQKLSVADQRRVNKAQENRSPLPARTPNFDDELAAVNKRLNRSKTTRPKTDDFAEFYLNDEGKSMEELDADFMSFEKLEQYDENGIVGFSMSDCQHAVVAYQLTSEVDASYLPDEISSLSREMNLVFVGHKIGGVAAREARRFVFEQKVLRSEMQNLNKGIPCIATTMPPLEKFSNLPFSQADFSDWLAAKLDYLYPHRTMRSIRRLATNKAGLTFEFQAKKEVNPDFTEMQYVYGVCKILWNQMRADFHLRSLRNPEYQTLHLAIRQTKDTAEVARLKKEAYTKFKVHKKLSLKEFTALNTAAKSQEARLAKRISAITRKTLEDISSASVTRVRYLKYFLYNDASIKSLTRQEKQRLWDAIRTRESALKTAVRKNASVGKKEIQQSLFQTSAKAKQVVRVTPQSA